MVVNEIFGYKTSRNLAKGILLASAIAISTFATGEFLSKIFQFEFGIEVINIIAILLIVVGLLIREDILNPPVIPFTGDRGLSKIIYYVALGIIAIGISTLAVEFLDNILDITFLDFAWFAVRNIITVGLLISVRTIHVSG